MKRIRFDWLNLLLVVSTIFAALLGAIVGGLMTERVATTNTRSQLALNAYAVYLAEAARVGTLAAEGTITDVDKARLTGATTVLMMYGDERMICKSLEIAEAIAADKPFTNDTLRDLLKSFREAATDEKKDKVVKECSF